MAARIDCKYLPFTPSILIVDTCSVHDRARNTIVQLGWYCRRNAEKGKKVACGGHLAKMRHLARTQQFASVLC